MAADYIYVDKKGNEYIFKSGYYFHAQTMKYADGISSDDVVRKKETEEEERE